MKKAVLFDLGNTLVAYYLRAEWPGVARECIGGVRDLLAERGALEVAEDELWRRVEQEDYVAADHRVRPLEGRLARIFGLPSAAPDGKEASSVDRLCRRFMEPIFARARPFEDAVPVLTELRDAGLRTAIVSNTPWGSPAALWREELERHGLAERVDLAVFCGDVGWRKPDRRIFVAALEALGVGAQDCAFVGDDARWDVAGPRAVGMEAVLVDRDGSAGRAAAPRTRSLRELRALLRL